MRFVFFGFVSRFKVSCFASAMVSRFISMISQELLVDVAKHAPGLRPFIFDQNHVELRWMIEVPPTAAIAAFLGIGKSGS